MAKGFVLERELCLPVILAKRVDPDEWSQRDRELAFIPAGSVVLEIDDQAFTRPDIRFETVNPNYLLELNLAKAYFVEGHAGPDQRPLCRPIGQEGGEWDLDLLLAPIILGSGAKYEW